jgi:hypothetical protein
VVVQLGLEVQAAILDHIQVHCHLIWLHDFMQHIGHDVWKSLVQYSDLCFPFCGKHKSKISICDNPVDTAPKCEKVKLRTFLDPFPSH